MRKKKQDNKEQPEEIIRNKTRTYYVIYVRLLLLRLARRVAMWARSV